MLQDVSTKRYSEWWTNARSILLRKCDIQLSDPKCIASNRISVHDILVSHQGKRAIAKSNGKSISSLLESDKSRQSEAPCTYIVAVRSIEHSVDDHSVNHSKYSNGAREYYISMGGR